VNDALMRALAKAPADRFNPVGQFSTAIRPSAVTASSHAAVSSSRRSVGWTAAVGIVLALAVASVTWAVARGRSASAGASERSVAVLPFDNLSGDTSVVPLILGVHAEMVTQLTKIAGLKVASRTSALEYRNSTKNDREIASELGVATLLRGTIQRSGNKVRFAVALADAPNGKELWAESYDRPYTVENLFEVQGDIARQVASALRIQLSAQQQQQLARAPTSNVAALDAYYRGQLAWSERSSGENDAQAVAHLERAVELDTSFVAAWNLLAQARSWLIRRGFESDTMWAWAAVQRVQRLAPGSPEAAVAQGYYRYYARGDFAGALHDLTQAARITPNSTELLYPIALLDRRLGRWDDAWRNCGVRSSSIRAMPCCRSAWARRSLSCDDSPRRGRRSTARCSCPPSRSRRTPNSSDSTLRWGTRLARAPSFGAPPACCRIGSSATSRRSSRSSPATIGLR
jgi:TolB-like protein